MVQQSQPSQPNMTGARWELSFAQADASTQSWRSNASEGRSSAVEKQQKSTGSSCAKIGLINSLDCPPTRRYIAHGLWGFGNVQGAAYDSTDRGGLFGLYISGCSCCCDCTCHINCLDEQTVIDKHLWPYHS